jgi:hypothetical protein
MLMTRHLVHASDAEQAEALLTRWGPDGLGKLGGKHHHFSPDLATHTGTPRSPLGKSYQKQSAPTE